MKRLLTILIVIYIRLCVPSTPHILDKHPAPSPFKHYKQVSQIQDIKDKPVAELSYVGYPLAPQGTYANSYDWGNCTAYVASRIRVGNWGNANNWANAARSEGIPVSQTPIVGSIAQSTAGYFGHVAVVVSVGAGTVTVDEMNVESLGAVDEATYPISYFNNYIYI